MSSHRVKLCSHWEQAWPWWSPGEVGWVKWLVYTLWHHFPWRCAAICCTTSCPNACLRWSLQSPDLSVLWAHLLAAKKSYKILITCYGPFAIVIKQENIRGYHSSAPCPTFVRWAKTQDLEGYRLIHNPIISYTPWDYVDPTTCFTSPTFGARKYSCCLGPCFLIFSKRSLINIIAINVLPEPSHHKNNVKAHMGSASGHCQYAQKTLPKSLFANWTDPNLLKIPHAQIKP